MPLGVEDGRVADQVMTASSYNGAYYGPWNGRLNRPRGGWWPRRNERRPWLQIDFLAMTKVTRVATQGLYNANYWVKKYYIKYARNKNRFVPYREGRKTKVWFFYLESTLLTKLRKTGRRDGRWSSKRF